MPSSLVKFSDTQKSDDGRQVFWKRAEQDGAPFRASHPPTMPEEMLEERLIEVGDPYCQIFNVLDPDSLAEYKKVHDMIQNGWATQLYIDRNIDPEKVYSEKKLEEMKDAGGVKLVYMEWILRFVEDGGPPLAWPSIGSGIYADDQ